MTTFYKVIDNNNTDRNFSTFHGSIPFIQGFLRLSLHLLSFPRVLFHVAGGGGGLGTKRQRVLNV